jgi:hypothetical protein
VERKNAYSGWTVVFGTICFILIVIFLHMVQPNYNPLEQQMSELALGRFGSFMFLAFSSFALSIFALQIGLRRYQTPVILRLILIVAACCLLGAGFFRLDTATDVHIALVSIAFVLIVLVMYLLPRNVPAFKTSVHKIISWASGAGTATFVALSQNIVPMGIGQRGATLCILIWLAWIGRSLICNKKLASA